MVKQFSLLRQVDPEFARTLDVTEPIIGCLRFLTIRELMELFPIDKYWDKEKICVDYDSTIEHLKNYDWDIPMGDKTEEILCEYVNRDGHKVVIDHTLASLHRYEEETGESPLMELLQQEGIEPFRPILPMGFCKPKKKIPPYLRLVK